MLIMLGNPNIISIKKTIYKRVQSKMTPMALARRS